MGSKGNGETKEIVKGKAKGLALVEGKQLYTKNKCLISDGRSSGMAYRVGGLENCSVK